MQYLTSATVSKRRAEQRTSVVHANGSGIIYRHTGGERSLDMFDRALPFDLAERRVDVYRLAARRNPGQQDRHVMACLPSPVSTATSAPARIIPCTREAGDYWQGQWASVDLRGGGVESY